MKPVWWSEIPGIISTLLIISVWLLVKKRSSMLVVVSVTLVGSATT